MLFMAIMYCSKNVLNVLYIAGLVMSKVYRNTIVRGRSFMTLKRQIKNNLKLTKRKLFVKVNGIEGIDQEIILN